MLLRGFFLERGEGGRVGLGGFTASWLYGLFCSLLSLSLSACGRLH